MGKDAAHYATKYIFSVILLGVLFYKNYENLLQNDVRVIDLKSINQSRDQDRKRSPAGVVESMRVQNHILQIDWGCTVMSSVTPTAIPKQNENLISIASEYIQLTGKICSQEKWDEKNTEVQNLSNNTGAWVFKTSENEYTSDLIYLNPGKNLLQLKTESKLEPIQLGVLRQ